MGIRLPERLRTSRLLIRRLEAIDDVPMAELIERNLEHLRPWLSWAHSEPVDADERRRRFQQCDAAWKRHYGWEYVIELVGTGRPIGRIGAHRVSRSGAVELGYWLDKEHEGRGIMTDSVLALTWAAFDLKRVVRVQIRASPDNPRSTAIPRRLGFTYEGLLRSHEALQTGGFRDAESWSLIQGDPIPDNPVLTD